MRRLYLAMLAGCYAPHPVTGAPCVPAAASCPLGQMCELVAGTYVCVADGTSQMVDAAQMIDGPAPDIAPLAPWLLVQHAGNQSDHVLLPQPSGAGHLLVVAVETRTATAIVTSLTDDANNTYTQVAGTRSSSAQGGFGLELWYAAGSLPNAKKIFAVTGQTPVADVFVWEVAGIRSAAPVASAAALLDQPPSTLPKGAPITTTAPGELVIAVAVVNNNATGIAGGNAFTNDSTLDGDGWAHLTDNEAPPGTYQAQWTQPNAGAYCASSAAFFVGP